jgi:hypothetical protein
LRPGDQRARQCDTLLFSAGYFCGPSRAEIFDPKGLQDLSDSNGALRFGQGRQAISDVFFYSHVRKQRERLEDVGHASTLRRHVHARFGVEEDVITDFDLAGVRAQQSRNAIQQRGFSGSGGAEQNGNAGGNFEREIQYEKWSVRGAPLEENAQRERHSAYRAGHADQIRRPTRRLIPYTMESTTNENVSRISARRFASAYSRDCTWS